MLTARNADAPSVCLLLLPPATVRSASQPLRTEGHSPPVRPKWKLRVHSNIATADKREFIKISQAVGVGFVVMGAIGYIVKLGMFRTTSSLPNVRQRRHSTHPRQQHSGRRLVIAMSAAGGCTPVR